MLQYKCSSLVMIVFASQVRLVRKLTGIIYHTSNFCNRTQLCLWFAYARKSVCLRQKIFLREQYFRFRKIYFLRKQEKNFAYANLFYVRAHLIIILRSQLYYFEQARRLTCLRDHMFLRVQIDICECHFIIWRPQTCNNVAQFYT